MGPLALLSALLLPAFGTLNDDAPIQTPLLVFYGGSNPIPAKPNGLSDVEVAKLASSQEYLASKGEGVTFLFHRKSLGLDAIDVSIRVVTELLRGGRKANGFELDWTTLTPESRKDIESLLNQNPLYRANGGTANLRPTLAPLAAISVRKGDKQFWEMWRGAPAEAPSSRQVIPPAVGEEPKGEQPKDGGPLSFDPSKLDQIGIGFYNTRSPLAKRTQWIQEGSRLLAQTYGARREKLDEAKTSLVEKLLQGLDPNFHTGMFRSGMGMGDLPDLLRDNLGTSVVNRLMMDGMSESDAESWAGGARVERIQWDLQIEFRWTQSDGNRGGMSINLTP